MYRVSVFGHRPENVYDTDKIQRLIERTLELLKHQYGEGLIINLVGDIGINQWAAEKCAALGIKYHLFLPCPPEELSEAWYEEQKESLVRLFRYAWANTIYSQEFNYEVERETHNHAIDMSDFSVAFWNGKKQGLTCDNIRYSLKKNKITLNGFQDLRMITNEDLQQQRKQSE